MEEFKIQPNGFNEQAPSISNKEISSISEPINQAKNNLPYDGIDSVLVSGSVRTKNFRLGKSGWKADANSITAAFIGNQPATSTHFYKVLTDATSGISLWIGDGTTANGALTGTAGDVLLNGGSHKPEYCTGTTNWTALV